MGARGRLMLMLMLRLTPSTWLPPTLATPMPVMASVTLVIPILLPMDMETLAMLELAMPAMLVLDLAMDIPTLPLLEPAEIILELLSHAKFEQLILPVCYHLFLIKNPPLLKKKKKKKKKK